MPRAAAAAAAVQTRSSRPGIPVSGAEEQRRKGVKGGERRGAGLLPCRPLLALLGGCGGLGGFVRSGGSLLVEALGHPAFSRRGMSRPMRRAQAASSFHMHQSGRRGWCGEVLRGVRVALRLWPWQLSGQSAGKDCWAGRCRRGVCGGMLVRGAELVHAMRRAARPRCYRPGRPRAVREGPTYLMKKF